MPRNSEELQVSVVILERCNVASSDECVSRSRFLCSTVSKSMPAMPLRLVRAAPSDDEVKNDCLSGATGRAPDQTSVLTSRPATTCRSANRKARGRRPISLDPATVLRRHELARWSAERELGLDGYGDPISRTLSWIEPDDHD